MIHRRLRIGAFGVGRMGLVHLESLIQLHAEGGVDLVAMGDRHDATLSAARERVAGIGAGELASHLSIAASAGDMAHGAGLDAVVIASRTEDHVRDALAFIRRGIAVLVEKPIVGSIADAAVFASEAGSPVDRLVQVGFQRHYDEAAQTAQTWLTQGLIGSLQQTHHVLQDKNPTPVGYQSPGITADMAIHLVFEAMSVRGFALPCQVQALRFLAPHYEDRAAEGANIVHVFCRWPDESIAHLWGSRINATGYDNGFKLVGTEGRIDVGEFVGDFGEVSARLWRGVGHGPVPRGTLVESREFPMTRPADRHPDFYARFAAAYAAELREFVRRVAAGEPLEPGLDIGWKTLLVANVAEESARLGGRPFNLAREDGGPIRTAHDAAALAASIGVA
jgi:myo-inositol 2-dehydrogenase/D-chiro-inositol 1-dehydrogenase